MSKKKTHSGAKKRFKLSGKGKIKHKAQNKGHLLTGRSSKNKRQLRNTGWVGPSDQRRLDRMLAVE